ncbi:hypothetical protein LCGC14_2952380, partial [marine sediment metagenome]
MIIPISHGFIAELELVAGDLFLEIFMADKAFRPIQPIQVMPANTETTSTITFSDTRLANGFKYFVRFFTKAGGLKAILVSSYCGVIIVSFTGGASG